MTQSPVPYWRPFLSLFAQELTQNLAPPLLRRMMRETGVQFAAQFALGPAGTVAEMQDAINRIWHELHWGEVEIGEQPTCLVLKHRRAPFDDVLGLAHRAWTGAFLEGAYEAWMYQLGADRRLQVSTVEEGSDAAGSLVFLFGK